jgi:hypothetical protein
MGAITHLPTERDRIITVGEPTRLTCGRQCSVRPVRFDEYVIHIETRLKAFKLEPATPEDLEYWLVQNINAPVECRAICAPIDSNMNAFALYIMSDKGWEQLDDLIGNFEINFGEAWLLCRNVV